MEKKHVNCTIATAILLFAANSFAACPPYAPTDIPEAYFALSEELAEQLEQFDLHLDANPIPGNSTVAFAATLTSAGGNRGRELLDPEALEGVQLQLEGLAALGLDAVTLVITYPILDPQFLDNEEETAQMLEFYRQVVDLIRERGLKLVIVNMDAFSQGVFAGWPRETLAPYYNLDGQPNFDVRPYRASRAAMARLIAEELQPDYLTVVKEPYTSATHTGIAELDTPEGTRRLTETILTEIHSAGVSGVSVGAGVGNWQLNYRDFVEVLAALPIDYVDVNVWKVSDDTLGDPMLLRLSEIHDIASAYNKPLAISDTWLAKGSEYLLSAEQVDVDMVFARDKYEFWSPLDADFIDLLAKFSRQHELAFFSPFGWGHFRSYYRFSAQVDTMPPAESFQLSLDDYRSAVQRAEFSETARRYSATITGVVDDEAPSTPGNLGVSMADLSAVAVSWDPAPDNVGAAGYRVYRNGEWLLDTPYTSVFDDALAQATEYSYSVASFDVMCNESPHSPPAEITTPDLDHPSTPTALHFSNITDSQMSLSWAASQDNVGVDGYRLYVGETPEDLDLVETTDEPLYLFSELPPAFTICSAVDAFDVQGNVSAVSEPVCGQTQPDVTPPTRPQGFTAVPVSEAEVNLVWDSSTDNAAVWRYRLHIGTEPDQLQVLASTPDTFYSVTGLFPGTTYYFSVDAVDAAGNVSPRAETIAVKIAEDLTPPSIPTGLVATGVSSRRIDLSWEPSNDNVQLYGYLIYAGTDETIQSIFAFSENTTFSVDNLPADTGLYFSVAAFDIFGNISEQSTVARGQTLADDVAPTIPTDVAGYTQGRQVTLQWSASSDDAGVWYYLVHAGVEAESQRAISYTFETTITLGPVPVGVEIFYSVQAVDINRNTSSLSAAIPITAVN